MQYTQRVDKALICISIALTSSAMVLLMKGLSEEQTIPQYYQQIEQQCIKEQKDHFQLDAKMASYICNEQPIRRKHT